MAKKTKAEQGEQEVLETDTAEQEVLEETEQVNEADALLKEKDEALSALNDRYMRLAAEYDNFKKRTIREKEAIYTDSVGDTVAALLPVMDNLSRALASFPDKEGEYYKGVEMVLKQTQDIFTNLGVTEIPSVGEEFNPELHSAVMHIEDETVADNTVVEEFQKGYKYKDKVIRYSMVKVAN
ncbi:MAG: nucleotide exchange factor GrpE [Ruminococcaceae bacterium]|nr:nucleotide exchange factor GrpE [Oscillospiraceae bacterium]